jgi:alkanesulfonate monooxygenase SsuD/methylene tetrahydromethanopterin reductase-like flavin-dependent oxidoreductase (luciferase family)
MQRLWTDDEASFHGTQVSFDASWSWPKPTQKPHPPIILGGSAGPKTAAHIAEFCDGWMPIGGRYQLEAGVTAVRRACESIGRDPATLSLGVFGAKPDAKTLDSLESMGFERAVLGLGQGPRDEVLADLERLTPLLDR